MSDWATELGKGFAIFAQGLVDWYAAGGNPLVYIMAMLGAFCIMASVIRDSGKTLATLFIVLIALPILSIEYLIKKYKIKRGEKNDLPK